MACIERSGATPWDLRHFAITNIISLETFKKNGDGVKTPVWFAADPASDIAGEGALLYMYTIGNTGKVKRIRNNGHVKIAPCTMKGVPLGEFVDAKAEIVTGEVASQGHETAQQKIFSSEANSGFLCAFQPARKSRHVDSASAIDS